MDFTFTEEEAAFRHELRRFATKALALISDFLTRNATGEVVPSLCVTEPEHGADAAALAKFWAP